MSATTAAEVQEPRKAQVIINIKDTGNEEIDIDIETTGVDEKSLAEFLRIIADSI